MKLTGTATYLSLILATLETRMIPDLQSENVRSDAIFVAGMLRELLRRERDYPAVLPTINEEGSAIAAKMQAALGIKAAAPTCDNADPVNVFGQICETVSGLAESLCRNDLDATLRSTLLRCAADWEYESHTRMLGMGKANTEDTHAQAADPLPRHVFQKYIQSVHPDGDKAVVMAFDRVPGGFGKQTSAITLQDASGRQQQLIVRKCDRMPTSLHKSFDLEREFHLVAAVNRSGFPAPKPLWMGSNVPGSNVTLAIRPEALLIRLEGQAKLRVREVVFSGAACRVELTAADGSVLEAEIHRQETIPAVGSEVAVSVADGLASVLETAP